MSYLVGEVSQTEKDKHCMISLIESKINDKMNLFTKQKQTLDIENELMVTREGE